MLETEPQIFLISKPTLDWESMYLYLQEVGGLTWYDRVATMFTQGLMTEAEVLVEFHARNCYRSFDVGLNPNVQMVRTDSSAYFENIKKSGHGSVFEHSNFSFVFHNVSRVFTHELVRHRAGVAISQESLRYVRLTDIKFRIPDILKPMENVVVSLVETLEDFQKEAASVFDLDGDNDNVPFHVKKEVTSALRRLAPLGLSTTIGWTANARTLRFVIEKRTESAAEEEIRTVFQKVARMMGESNPLLFGDYRQNAKGEFTSPFGKI